jgi:acyl carrier protein
MNEDERRTTTLQERDAAATAARFPACAEADYITGSTLKVDGSISNSMEDANALKERIKAMMVENLMLQVAAAQIGDDLPLFGPGGLGLDSVDALQLVVALDKNFGLKIPDPSNAKVVLQSVNTMAEAVQKKMAV